MTSKIVVGVGVFGLLSTCLFPVQLMGQGVPDNVKGHATTYEDDRIKIVIQDCNRKSQDLVCQATLTGKSSDRMVELNGNNIKLIDTDGNEYYPSNLRLANRSSENNSIKTELIENIPFKASFTFTKVPANLAQVALLQIPLSGGINVIAKFRNIAIVERNSVGVKTPKTITAPNKQTSISTDNSESISICPDNTKILYRASSKSYLMYICGAKNPTHYVGLSKDGTQGITLRLRYYDRTQFSADNGDTNYTIAANRLVIRKDSKIIYQEKIQVLQSLPGATITEETTSKTKPKKTSSSENNNVQKRGSNSQPGSKVKRKITTAE